MRVIVALILTLTVFPAWAQREVDRVQIFQAAVAASRIGEAQKTRPVDARPARVGEVVVTVIRGDGVETRSRPAQDGDWVVRNRCPETGNEEYVVTAARFPERYRPSQGPADAQGWREFEPIAAPVEFFTLRADEGEMSFVAPWGQRMIARPRDVIVRNPRDHTDIYRIYWASFDCTYQVTRAPTQ
ncbi:MAG: hypothetical protein FJX57_16800 [Alphaproteobacteria bacterium]|nr:hypothetical protein [Alphaproteobacteria bacterium]